MPNIAEITETQKGASVRVTGVGSIADKGIHTTDANGNAALRIINEDGTIGGGGGASSADKVSFDPTGLKVIKSDNVQGALAETDAAVADLQDSASILQTSVALSNTIGADTVVMLDELSALEIDGRPNYKEPGATVYGPNGQQGIIHNVDAENQSATIKTTVLTGGLSAVSHDTTLTGAGTDADPLRVAAPIPSGGTAGQVLTKTADGSQWADATGGAGGIEWDITKNLYAGLSDNVYTSYNLGALPHGEYEFYAYCDFGGPEQRPSRRIWKFNMKWSADGGFQGAAGIVMDGNSNGGGSNALIPSKSISFEFGLVNNQDVILYNDDFTGLRTNLTQSGSWNGSADNAFGISKIKNLSTGEIVSAKEINVSVNEYPTAYRGESITSGVKSGIITHLQFFNTGGGETIFADTVGAVVVINGIDRAVRFTASIKDNNNSQRVANFEINHNTDGYSKQIHKDTIGDVDVVLVNGPEGKQCAIVLPLGRYLMLWGIYGSENQHNVTFDVQQTPTISNVPITGSQAVRLASNDITADNVGHVVQYVGATNSLYTNGYFYKATQSEEQVAEHAEITITDGDGTLSDPNLWLHSEMVIANGEEPLNSFFVTTPEVPEGDLEEDYMVLGLLEDGNQIWEMPLSDVKANGVEITGSGTFHYVYTPEGTATVSKWERTDVQPAGGTGGSSTDNNGLEGDYCSKYGIVDETTSGLPTMGTGNQVIIPAGLVLDVPGSPGLTTNGSKITHDLTATTNCELWMANGNVLEVTDMFWQLEEPENGTTGYAGWWNGTEMKFKSNDTGNVWRAANAARVAKCVFTDGNLTRLCFTGCRLLNRQEFAPKDRGLPEYPTEQGTYTLKATVATGGGVTVAWIKDA